MVKLVGTVATEVLLLDNVTVVLEITRLPRNTVPVKLAVPLAGESTLLGLKVRPVM